MEQNNAGDQVPIEFIPEHRTEFHISCSGGTEGNVTHSNTDGVSLKIAEYIINPAEPVQVKLPGSNLSIQPYNQLPVEIDPCEWSHVNQMRYYRSRHVRDYYYDQRQNNHEQNRYMRMQEAPRQLLFQNISNVQGINYMLQQPMGADIQSTSEQQTTSPFQEESTACNQIFDQTVDSQPLAAEYTELQIATISNTVSSNTDVEETSSESAVPESNINNDEEVKEAETVIAKVVSDDLFHLNIRSNKRCSKMCRVCSKEFVRVGDLKEHLIEHIVASTLAKAVGSRRGKLWINCQVCHKESFSKIEKYKTHLRRHAKLAPVYKCIICDVHFGDYYKNSRKTLRAA